MLSVLFFNDSIWSIYVSYFKSTALCRRTGDTRIQHYTDLSVYAWELKYTDSALRMDIRVGTHTLQCSAVALYSYMPFGSKRNWKVKEAISQSAIFDWRLKKTIGIFSSQSIEIPGKRWRSQSLGKMQFAHRYQSRNSNISFPFPIHVSLYYFTPQVFVQKTPPNGHTVEKSYCRRGAIKCVEYAAVDELNNDDSMTQLWWTVNSGSMFGNRLLHCESLLLHIVAM